MEKVEGIAMTMNAITEFMAEFRGNWNWREDKGRDPPALLRLVEESSANEEIDSHIRERNSVLDELKTNLTKAQERMKRQADLGRRETQFQVGDLVFLKLQPYRFHSLAKKPNEKLNPRF